MRLLPGGHLDRGGAVVGGEAVTGREPGDVTDLAGDGGGDDRTDAEQLSQRRAGRRHGGGDPLARFAALDPQPLEVGDQLQRDFVTGSSHRADRFELIKQSGRLSRADLTGDAAGNEIAQHRVQPAGDPVVRAGQVAVTLRPHLHHRRVILDADTRNRR